MQGDIPIGIERLLEDFSYYLKEDGKLSNRGKEYSQRTIRAYIKDVEKLAEKNRDNQTTLKQLIYDLEARVKEGENSNTTKMKISSLKQFTKFLESRGYLTEPADCSFQQIEKKFIAITEEEHLNLKNIF